MNARVLDEARRPTVAAGGSPQPAKPVGGASHAPAYRPDIDGLRAVAVLAVVFFHLDHRWLSGGFVGVDVFFVISGFLITGLIHNEARAGRFSIKRFYERRVRRLFPALLAVLTATTVAAVVLFTPDELKDFGAGLAGAASFASNFVFWRQAGYFAGAAELNALLHTWSLAVEEQYYLFFPLLIILTQRLFGGRHIAVLAPLAVASFAISVWGAYAAPIPTFFLAHTRAWELFLGALLALGAFPSTRSRALTEILAVVGLALVAASLFILNEDMLFPGLYAAPACLGVAMLLYAGTQQHRALITRLLSWRVFVFVGLISYSLYLWHWPMIVFTRYALLRELTLWEQGTLLVASLGVGALSWRFIERPFRGPAIPRRPLFIAAAVASVLAIVCGSLLWWTNGLPQRFPGLERAERDGSALKPNCFLDVDETYRTWAGDRCMLAHGGGRRVLVWGDSHASHLMAGLMAEKKLSSDVLLYSSAGCLPVFAVDDRTRPNCKANNAHVWEVIDRYRIQKVVLSGSWEYGLKRGVASYGDVRDTIAALRRRGLEVALIGQSPFYPIDNPQFLARRLKARGVTDYDMAPDLDWEMNLKLATLVPPGEMFDPTRFLCRERRCRIYADGELMVKDSHHLSPYASRKVVAAARDVFE